MKTSPLRLTQIGAEWLTVSAGGVSRYTEGLARGLSGLDTDQTWLAMGDGDVVAAPRASVRSVASPSDPLRTRWRAIRGGWRDAAEADVVTSHFALYGYPVRKQLQRLPHVVHFHGPWAEESRAEGANRLAVQFKRWIERSVYKTGNRCLTLSQAFADVLSEQYAIDPSLIRVVPGGVDADRFDPSESRDEARTRLGWATDRPIVLCVRRLVHRVGLEQLVAAMKPVVEACPDALLLIAGKGPLSQTIEELIKESGLGESVRLLGFVPDEDLPLAYRAADLTIVPSQSLEGFGLIIPESLAAGTPALVTPIGGMPEVVKGLSEGLILDGPAPRRLADGLIAALKDPRGLPDAESCREYARSRFDWPIVAERILSVYREAIAAHGG